MKGRILSACMAIARRADHRRPGKRTRSRCGSRPHTRVVVFGDSLSDPGNYFAAFHEISQRPFAPVPDAPYAMGGLHYSNGETWIEQLGHDLHAGDSAGPALRHRRQRHQFCGGPGAGAPGSGGVSALRPVDPGRHVPRPDRRPGARRRALRAMDRRQRPEGRPRKPCRPIRPSCHAIGIIQQAVGTTAGNIQALWNAGARRFLVVDMPDLAITPYIIGLGPVAQYAAGHLTDAYNAGLGQVVDALERPARDQHSRAST